MNFLQAHYNRYRQEGGGHLSYAVINDLSDEMSSKLKLEYEKMYPEPVSEEKKRQFEEALKKESEEASWQNDDLDWLMGTGRYGQ